MLYVNYKFNRAGKNTIPRILLPIWVHYLQWLLLITSAFPHGQLENVREFNTRRVTLDHWRTGDNKYMILPLIPKQFWDSFFHTLQKIPVGWIKHQFSTMVANSICTWIGSCPPSLFHFLFRHISFLKPYF